jgi:hypothetical protein
MFWPVCHRQTMKCVYVNVKEPFWQCKNVSVLYKRKLKVIKVLLTALGYTYIDI